MTREEIKLLEKLVRVQMYRYKQILTEDSISAYMAETVLKLLSSGHVDQNYEWTNKSTIPTNVLLYLKAQTVITTQLDYMRAQRRDASNVSMVPIEDLPSKRPELPIDLQIDLKRFLERMEKTNKIILAKYREGYSLTEIAKSLNVSLKFIERRLHKIQVSSAEFFQIKGYKELVEQERQEHLRQNELSRLRKLKCMQKVAK